MPTYGEVKTEFTALLNRRDATPTQITTFLQNAIRRAQRTLRIPSMERGVEVVIADPYEGVPIPDDFLELIRITRASDNIELDRRDFSTVSALAAGVGIPRTFTRQGPYFLLGPTPTEGSEYRIDYYAEFEEVSADGDENMLTLLAPDIIVYGALVYACRHFTDKRLPVMEETYKQIVGELTEQAMRDELSGGAVVTNSNPFPADD